MIENLRPYMFFVVMLVCTAPHIGGGVALLIGLALTLSIGHPCPIYAKKWIKIGMGVVITCLGAGIDIAAVLQAGRDSILVTALSVFLVIACGYALGRVLRTPPAVSILISVGTAICGGSAIAALSPAIKARDEHTSIALGCVFILNALALLIFPYIGRQLGMSDIQFGTWVGIAIHDTSSVVGAAAQFGDKSLEVATIVKLVRALWIVPCVAIITFIWMRNKEAGKEGAVKTPLYKMVPWFLYGFLLMSAVFSYVPQMLGFDVTGLKNIITYGGKRAMEVILFLIGASLSMKTIRAVGISSLAQAFLLWLGVSIVTALCVLNFL